MKYECNEVKKWCKKNYPFSLGLSQALVDNLTRGCRCHMHAPNLHVPNSEFALECDECISNQPERSKREDSDCLAPDKCPSVKNGIEWLCEACFYD